MKLTECGSAVPGMLLLSAMIAGVGYGPSSDQSPIEQSRYVAVENLRIESDESSSDRILTEVRDVVPLPGGDVVIAFARERSLRVYDSTGLFKRNIGLWGAGPGEVQSLTAVGRLADTLWVMDSPGRKIVYLDMTGRHIRTVRNTNPTQRGFDGVNFSAVLPGDKYLISTQFRLQRQSGTSQAASTASDSLQWFVADALVGGTRVPIFSRRNDAASLIRVDLPDSTVMYLEQLLEPRILWHVAAGSGQLIMTADPGIWGGPPGSLRIMSWDDRTGNPVYSEVQLNARRPTSREVDSLKNIRGGRAPSTIAERARRESIVKALHEHLIVPDYLPIAGKLVAGEDGSVWLRDMADPSLWSVIERGAVTRQVVIPRQVQVMRASSTTIWAVGEDADGIPFVVRYFLRRAD